MPALRMLIFLVATLVVGLVIGGAVWGVRYLQDKQFSDDNTLVAFIDLEEFNISKIRNGQVVETRTYGLTIETRQGNPYRLVIEQRPKLRDIYQNYITALSTRSGPENWDNPDYVRAQLQKASDEFLGPKAVFGVLIKTQFSR